VALPQAVETEAAPDIADDRDTISADDKVVLIVEGDRAFASTLLDVARQKKFRGIVTSRGDAAVPLARRYRPDAITLDVQLDETSGWRVLDLLKHDPATRHIPVHIISVADERQRALRQGAFAHLTKPVTGEALEATFTNIRAFIERGVRNLLVVEDDDVERSSIVDLIGNNDVHVTAVATGQEALEAIDRETIDCMVLDLDLSDMSGLELLEELRGRERLAQVPVIVYTGKDLSAQEEAELRRVAETIIVKDVKSPDRLLDETALFLHRIQENLPEAKRRMLEQLRHTDPALAGRTVLIVDDEVRNTFALASALEQYQMQVIPAENGRDGIEILKNRPGIDVVLMDVMMPEMDGYEATRAIRALPQFRTLPIIALTAKAMKGDRDLCIEAGASDYVTEPVDTDQLISLLRVWLYR
jgi:CheY-like chemotaxis protein